MWKVDIDLLKKLRNITQAPLKDCKKALIKAEGDIDKAQDILREEGALKAAKKADRQTNEWVVRAKKMWEKIAAVKVACETDFVAKSDKFIEIADKILDEVLSLDKEIKSIEELDENFVDSKLKPLINEAVAVIWENIKLEDVLLVIWQAYLYEHPGNKVIWIVKFKWNDENIAKEIALQAVAMAPDYVKVEDIPEEILNKYRQQFQKELEWMNKPAEILEKIIDGKMRKIYEEIVLLEQPWIRDDSQKVKNLIKGDFELEDVIRFAI